MTPKILKPNITSVEQLRDLLKTKEGSYSAKFYAEIFGAPPTKLAPQENQAGQVEDLFSNAEYEQAFIADALEIVRALVSNGLTITRAIEWFRNEPLSSFNSRTAEMIISEGKTDQLLQFLESWQAGSQG
ncbi:hypothetical protein [Pseudomonas soli]|uniref:hypothetical protein n=1 Tax=Pseudomonas soli TaxID=1306993 RepID=UPI0003C7B8D9|nr:hypothetical protein O165_023180 [Pseudomonas soli]